MYMSEKELFRLAKRLGFHIEGFGPYWVTDNRPCGDPFPRPMNEKELAKKLHRADEEEKQIARALRELVAQGPNRKRPRRRPWWWHWITREPRTI